jgi:hypothetical protein
VSSCGGLITFSNLTVSDQIASQIVGADEGRVSVTVKASPANVGTVYLLASPSQPISQGWALVAGEGYVFGGGATPYGARVALYVRGSIPGQVVYVTTEGA